MKRLVVLLLFLPSMAFGWGATGHGAICEIAYQSLNAEVRVEVDRLINLDSDYEFFTDSCSWVDSPRRRTRDHYINVPRSSRAITVDECPMADTCLFPAIKADYAILSDKDKPDDERLDALKFLAHWVGDIHQPMHVSFKDDRGANDIDTRGMCSGNLHGAWDGCMIERQIGGNPKALANRLIESITDADRLSWQFDSPVEWANESYQVTLSPETGYCTMKDGACWYWPHNMMLDEGELHREFLVTQDYLTKHQETIELRLKQAGIRLAEMLNKAMN